MTQMGYTPCSTNQEFNHYAMPLLSISGLRQILNTEQNNIALYAF